MNKARNNQQPTFSISTNPSNVTLSVQGNQLVGQTKVVFGNLNGYYTIDNSKLPSGVTISGHTEANGDVLTITAPQGYKINTNVFGNISVTPNNTTTVTVGNQRQVDKIRIEKTNSNPDMGDYSLQGAVFEVYNTSGSIVDTVTTNSSGQAITKNLTLGNYTVKEKTAPTGYVINTTEYKARLTYSGQTVSIVYDNVTVPNEPQTGTIKIVKQDSETGNISQGDATLDGAIFEVYSSSGALVQRLEFR